MTSGARVLRFVDGVEEAGQVADLILAARDEGVPFGSQAVLYRSGKLSNELGWNSTRRIPYRLFGGHAPDGDGASERRACDPADWCLTRDALSWARVLELHEGVGSKIADRLATAAIAAATKTAAGDLGPLEAGAARLLRRPAAAPACRAVRWLTETAQRLRAFPPNAVGEQFALALDQYRPAGT